MSREYHLRVARERYLAAFDPLVEFVNFLVAVIIIVATWTLVVELLAWADRRHSHR